MKTANFTKSVLLEYDAGYCMSRFKFYNKYMFEKFIHLTVVNFSTALKTDSHSVRPSPVTNARRRVWRQPIITALSGASECFFGKASDRHCPNEDSTRPRIQVLKVRWLPTIAPRNIS